MKSFSNNKREQQSLSLNYDFFPAIEKKYKSIKSYIRDSKYSILQVLLFLNYADF